MHPGLLLLAFQTIMPIRFADGHVYADLMVGSKKLVFVVDTGSTNSVIDRRIAKQIGVRIVGSALGHGPGGSTFHMAIGSKATFNVGATRFTTSKPFLVDLSGLNRPDREIDGLLGFDFFDRFVVTIDYRSQTLTLDDPKSFLYRGSGQVLPLKIKNNQPYISASLKTAGVPAATKALMLDTGSAESVDNDLIKKTTGPRSLTEGPHGLGRAGTVVAGVWTTVKLGKIELHDVDGSSGRALIGGGALSSLKVVIDYAHHHLIIER